MNSKIVHRLTLLSRSAGYFSLALGLLVLVGWIFDIAWAKSIHPSWIAMRVNTALCFVFAGIALILLQRAKSSVIVNVLGAAIAILGGLNLLQYLFHVDFGIDQLFVRQTADGLGSLPPGRMAANTAVNFVFVGLALIFPEAEIRGRARVGEILALLIGLLALPSLVGYLYGADFHAALTLYVQMAVHTATGFIVLSLGLLSLRPQRGFARLFTSPYAGGVQARGLIPSVVILPLAIGGLSLIGHALGLYEIRFAMTLTIMVTIAVLLHRVYVNGMLLDGLDQRRADAVDRLQVANRELEDQIRARTGELILAKKMAALGEMAGGIAHELNTPLATLTVSAEALRAELELDPDIMGRTSEFLHIIENKTERMAQIVRGLLAFAREGSKDQKMEHDLVEILKDTFALCSQKFDANNIKLVFEEPKNSVFIKCRPAELSHALLNLLSNAFDASINSAMPEVEVQIEHDSSRIEISITDNGTGISNDVAEKMTQPFFTTKEIGKGTGLGLPIAKGLIESHDGELFLDRAAKKTRFVIRFPTQMRNVKN